MQEECPQFFVNRFFWQDINQHCLRQSMEFSRPEYWSGKPFPSPGDLPDPGIEPRSPTWQANSLPAEPQGKPKNTGVGQPIPSPGDLPNPGIEPASLALTGRFFTTEPPQEGTVLQICMYRTQLSFTSETPLTRIFFFKVPNCFDRFSDG